MLVAETRLLHYLFSYFNCVEKQICNFYSCVLNKSRRRKEKVQTFIILDRKIIFYDVDVHTFTVHLYWPDIVVQKLSVKRERLRHDD